MSEHNSIQALFEYSIAAENYAEQMYRRFEEMFAAEPKIAACWLRYAAEEHGHASWLEKLLGGLPAEARTAPANTEMLETARHLVAVPLDKVLAQIQTLDDAYELAHELEYSEVNTVFEFLLTTFGRDMQTAQFVRKQLGDHVARLENEFPDPFTSAFRRRSVRAIS